MKRLVVVLLVCIACMVQNVYADVSVNGKSNLLNYENWLPEKAYIAFQYDSQNKLSGYRVAFRASNGKLFDEWKLKKQDGNTATFPFILESTLVIENKREVKKMDSWGFGRLDGENSEIPDAYIDSTSSDLWEDNYGIGIINPEKMKENVVYDYWIELKEDNIWMEDPRKLKVMLRFRLNLDLAAAKKFEYSKDEIERDLEIGDLWEGIAGTLYGYDNVDISKIYSTQYIGNYFSFAIEKYKPSSNLTYSNYFVLNGMEGQWCKNRGGNSYRVDSIERCLGTMVANPPDPEDSQIGDDFSNLPGSTTSTDPNASKNKPDLFVKELKLRDGKTKYYDDETIHVDAYAKNSGSSVSKSIKKVAFKLYRFKGEKENGDTKEVGDENIKGENLGSGKTKHEEFSFGVPSDEDKYQLYAVIDAKNSVSESNENNNRFGNLVFRAHKRPNLKVVELTLNGGQTQFEQGEIPSARATFTNTGGEPFQDVPVRWYLDGVHFADDNMRHWNIEHNDQKHEEVNLTQTLSIGNHTLKVCADFSEDKDQSNNCGSLVFSITAPVITAIAVDPDPISNSSCEYFDAVKVFHDGLVDNWIVFNPSLAATIKVIGQTSPNNYWSELSVFDGETCFANWPTSATPEFAAYYLDSQGNKQWLDALRCPEHLKGSPDPNDRHFIIRSDMSGSVADSTQFVPGEFCQYFELKKTSDTISRVDYQIIFAQTIPENLGFIGQSAPNSAWIAYAATNRVVTVSNWPKGQPIEFAVYYFDNQGNKWWLVAPLCPEYFNGSPDPNNQHFVVYLD